MTTPNIGHEWPGESGVYAGLIRNSETGEQYHLILAVTDESKIRGKYGSYGEVIEANSLTDGQRNTKSMQDAGSEIALHVATLSIDGHNDFYIPAQKELNLIYVNLQDFCEPVWHWSSTQDGALYAWLQDFEDGYQSFDLKSYGFAVRAVRRLPIK